MTKFRDCKMLGLHFEHCNTLGFECSFQGCNLTHSSFFGLKIKKTLFSNTLLYECDFANADLSDAVFEKCDLSGTVFENTTLEKADLRTAYNYSIDPELNMLKKAIFGLSGLAGLLNKYNLEIDEDS